MKARTGKALGWLAAVMYLVIGIGLYQSAYAEKLGGSGNDADDIGWWYDVTDDSDYGSFAVIATAEMMRVATYTRAAEECRVDGDVDYSCVKTREQILVGYIQAASERAVGGSTREHIARLFWEWCVKMELDRELNLGFAVSLYVDQVTDAFEDAS